MSIHIYLIYLLFVYSLNSVWYDTISGSRLLKEETDAIALLSLLNFYILLRKCSASCFIIIII